MPATFQKLGITFQYPDNWSLDEEDALAGRGAVTVYSPNGGAFWTVAVDESRSEPTELARAAADAMKEEYEGLESEDAFEIIEGHELVGHDLNFYCLDLTNTAQIRCLRTSRASYSIFCQAEDREFEQVQPVFNAMMVSLLGSLKNLSRW